MKLQTTFNRVARGLLRQGRLSFNREDFGFAIRGKYGCRCSIGFLIPNRVYRESMNGLGCDNSSVAEALKSLGHDFSLCWRLQKVHDEAPRGVNATTLRKFWKEQLKQVADEFGLDTKVLKHWRVTRGSATSY